MPPRIPGLQGHPRRFCLTCRPPKRGTAYEGHTLRSLQLLVREHHRTVVFPQGTLVLGPFVVRRDRQGWPTGEWHLGRGVVDWWALGSVCSWRGIPVRVISGDRASGSYLPDELRVLERPAEGFQSDQVETAA